MVYNIIEFLTVARLAWINRIPNVLMDSVDSGTYEIYRDPDTGAVYLQIQETNYQYTAQFKISD